MHFRLSPIHHETLFPGLSALMPCIGSALIIWAGEGGSSLVGAVLSWRPVVFVGLISYSLYLWHWPVIVLRKMGVIVGMGAIRSQHRSTLLSSHRFDMLVEIALSFVLAVVSWILVERPFSKWPFAPDWAPTFRGWRARSCSSYWVFARWTVFAGGFHLALSCECYSSRI